ncbi:MAG: hypothetical protein RMK30_01430 [Anaerolineae bacterium]|nr:hypothetical protein [Anaerolineae bacterium]MDW8101527.1 hypothetical protein [Anaerolineae bacterium]
MLEKVLDSTFSLRALNVVAFIRGFAQDITDSIVTLLAFSLKAGVYSLCSKAFGAAGYSSRSGAVKVEAKTILLVVIFR